MVLLLHGFPQSSAEWKAQLEVLAKVGYHAVAPDQPERSTYIASFEQEGAEGRGPDVVRLE